METEVFDVVVAGGGLAGLACAYQLRDRRVLLCEKESVLGGRIRTHVRNGLAYDMGAVLAYQENYLPFRPAGHRLYREGGPIGLSWNSKILYGETVPGCLEALLRDEPEEFEEITRFERGEVGFDLLNERSRVLLNAFFQGIHPGEIEEYIPLRRRDAFERYDPSHYHDGNYGLVGEFANRLTAAIRLNTEVGSVERDGSLLRITLREGKKKRIVRAKAAVAATTASAAADLFSRLRDVDPDFPRSVKYGRFLTVALGVEADFAPDFSYLVTPARAVTTIYKMSFPGTSLKVLLFFYCDKAAKKIEGCSDEEAVSLTLKEASAAGLPLSGGQVLFSDVVRWKEGGTLITPEYYGKLTPEVSNPSPGIFLAGDYLYKDFPYGMEAALRSGEAAGKAADAYLARDDDPLDRILALGAKASETSFPMTCHPPYPEAPYAYGDLVPLGFLLRALKAAPENERRDEVVGSLEKLLRGKRQGRLWAFHTDRLVTATDSSLVMLGVRDGDSLEALEAFYDGRSGYYPQLWSEKPEPGRMEAAFNNRHWCQVDFATTCLIGYLRRGEGLPRRTPLRFLEEGFAGRSGLFFANPFLTDWFLALALGTDEDGRPLRERLGRELLGAQQADGGFGRCDRILSTALAVLALRELGCRDGRLRPAAEFLKNPPAAGRERTFPFYSADRIDLENCSDAARLVLAVGNGDRLVDRDGKHYAVTLYEDDYGLITASLRFLALAAAEADGASSPAQREEIEAPSHPRYRCETPAEYVALYALPPYLGTLGRDEGEKKEAGG